MKATLLTQLGCLGSIAFALSLGNAAQAETNSPRTIVFAQTGTPITVSSGQTSKDRISDQSIEQLAIARYGCDCPGCRNLVIQSMQQL